MVERGVTPLGSTFCQLSVSLISHHFFHSFAVSMAIKLEFVRNRPPHTSTKPLAMFQCFASIQEICPTFKIFLFFPLLEELVEE